MKPPLFEYSAPQSVAEAVAILSEDPGAMILAGGQSLIPAMNFRLASPSQLVDLRNIPGLDAISIEDGHIHIGAMVRHRDLEEHADVRTAHPLIHETMRHVAHAPIRNRGTVVGSLCHADAAAEMPLIMVLTGGWLTAQGKGGERRIDAEDFFQFHMTTTREADEVVTKASIPVLPDGAGYAFHEFARRHGDYAIAAVGAIVECGSGGKIENASVAACGIGSKPIRLPEVETVLTGSEWTDEIAKRAVEASRQYVTASDDMHASAGYRAHLLSSLLKRTLSQAYERAKNGGGR